MYASDADERYVLLDAKKRFHGAKLNLLYYYVNHNMARRTVAQDSLLHEQGIDVAVHWEERAANPLLKLTCFNAYLQCPPDLLHVMSGVIPKIEMLCKALLGPAVAGQSNIFDRARVYGNICLEIVTADQRSTPTSDLVLSLPSLIPALAHACSLNVVGSAYDADKLNVLKYVALVTELLVCFTDAAPRKLDSHIGVLCTQLWSVVNA
jgi:hypothetical protein